MADMKQEMQLEHTPWPTPSRAIYGFVLYVVSYVIYVGYIAWALLPDSWLAVIGVTYLPARHWVITFPFLIYVSIIMILVFYGIMYLMNTVDMTYEDPNITMKGGDASSTGALKEDLTDLDVPVETVTDKDDDFLISKGSLRSRRNENSQST